MVKEKMLIGALIGVLFVSIISVPTTLPSLNELGLDFRAQVSGSQSGNATFTFSHDGRTMIAGRDRWVFILENGKRGDRVTVKAWKDNEPINGGRDLEICRVRRGTSCSKTATPGRRDIGSWREIVYINGVEKGTITVNVAPSTTTTSSVAPTASLSLSHETITAGQNLTYAWSSNNATAWSWSLEILDNNQNGSPRVSSDRCGTVAANWRGPVGGNSASGSWTVATADYQAKHTYYITYRARNSAGQEASYQRFVRVVAPSTTTTTTTAPTPAPTTIYYGCVNRQCVSLPQSDSRVRWFGPAGIASCRVTCEDGSTFPAPTYSFAGPVRGSNAIPVGNSYTYTLSNAQPHDILYVKAWKDGARQTDGARDGKFIICAVESNNYQCTKSAPATIHDVGFWEGEVGYTRNGVDYVLGRRGSVRFEVVR